MLMISMYGICNYAEQAAGLASTEFFPGEYYYKKRLYRKKMEELAQNAPFVSRKRWFLIFSAMMEVVPILAMHRKHLKSFR